jgi:hypothetical protein
MEIMLIMETISIILPTRKRPQFMERLCESAYSLADNKSHIETCFWIDDDDVESLEKIPDLVSKYRTIKYCSGKRDVLSKLWNNAYQISSGTILFHCGDDIVIQTKGWDTIVRDAFSKYPDRILLAHGDDGWDISRHYCFGTHSFISKKWAEVTGYFLPPYFVSDFNDNWLNDVSWIIGRHVRLDIFTEHLHFKNGKQPHGIIDENTKERLERHSLEKPQDLYNNLLIWRQSDAKKLLDYINLYNRKVVPIKP